MQQDSDNKRLEAHDIPEDVREYASNHHLHFEEFLWSPVVQRMLRLRIQMEQTGELPTRQGAQAPHVSWRHWQE